jgi:uncharacterized protein (DUF1330 family)
MPAYLIMTRHSTYDPDAMLRYSAIAATAPARTAELVASTKIGRSRVLEGAAPEALAIIRFDSWDDALAWYESPQYAAARAHRLPAGEFGAVLIEHN